MRRLLFIVHQYLGLILGLVFAFICVTGSLLIVLENPISGYRDYPMMRVPAGSQTVSLATMVQHVEQAYPGRRVEQILESCPVGCTYVLSVPASNDGRRDVLVNPYTGKILKATVWQNSAIGVLFAMHAELLSGERGAIACGALGIMFAALALTGLYLWPGWRNVRASLRVKWGGDQWRLNFDLHKIMGIVVVLFLIVIPLTGSARIFLPVPLPHSIASHVTAPRHAPLSLDTLVNEANAVLPGQLIAVSPALKPGDAVQIRKAVHGDRDPYAFSFVSVDQYSGKILDVFDIRKQPLISRFYTWMYPLHIGEVGGIVMRWIYFIVGLVPVALFYTGFMMWLAKLRREYASSVRRSKRAV